MRIEKCCPGYISNRKKISALWLLFYVVIAAGIFLAGYFLTHTRANVFTVLAVLLILPAAKRVVNLVVMLPKRSVSKERFHAVEKEAGKAVILTDYVFSSTEKIMHLDFVVIRDGNVMAVAATSKQDIEYMKKYFTDCVHRAASSYHVAFFGTDEQLIKRLAGLEGAEDEDGQKRDEKLAGHLRSFAV